MSAVPALLSVIELAFARNDEPVFSELNLQLGQREALLVEGRNGAGKTTLLRVLAGLLNHQTGEIRIEGRLLDRQSAAGKIALLGHLPGHKGDLSTEENLRFAAAVFGERTGATPADALSEVGLAGYEDQPARSLSAGQKKRLALARLRLVAAPLWLLDEPFANLDLQGIELVNRLVERHLGEGGAAVITSHGAYATGAYRTRHMRLP